MTHAASASMASKPLVALGHQDPALVEANDGLAPISRTPHRCSPPRGTDTVHQLCHRHEAWQGGGWWRVGEVGSVFSTTQTRNRHRHFSYVARSTSESVCAGDAFLCYSCAAPGIVVEGDSPPARPLEAWHWTGQLGEAQGRGRARPGSLLVPEVAGERHCQLT